MFLSQILHWSRSRSALRPFWGTSIGLVVVLLICSTLPCIAGMNVSGSLSGAVTETKLPNGLTVLLLESHDAPVACTYVFYKVGSRNETTGITGISHQIEHMMFKGTKKEFPTPGYIDLLIGRHGGVNNAETTTDYTDYYLLVPANQLDLALRIEADRMTNAAMDPKQLVAEKRVVLSELEGDENQNSGFLYDNMRTAAYTFHPYHYPVIGSKWDVEHFTREQVYDYYANHYCPNNAVLVVVGDFNTAVTLNRVRSLWKEVKSRPLVKASLDPEPKQLGERRVTIRRAGNTGYLDLCYHIPSGTSEDMPALDVLSAILTTGRSSRLYRALIEKQLATSVASNVNYGLDPELFEILVTEQSGVPESTVEAALLADMEDIKSHPISDHDLQKAKNQTRASFIFGQEGVQAKANRLGYFQVVTGSWRNIDTYLDRVNAVTSADLQRVFTKYFGGYNRTVAVFEPNGEKADPSADSGGASHSAHFRGNSAKPVNSVGPSSAPGVNLPSERKLETSHPVPPIKINLPNGLTLIMQEDHANPTVTVGGFIRAGSENDPVGYFGTANLMAGLLIRGANKRTSQEIADELDFIGADISFAAHRESIVISAVMLKENFQEVIKLAADCLTAPTLSDEELSKLRGETLTQIEEADNDTGYLANERLYSNIYPRNPEFAHDVFGNLDNVRAITVEQVRNFSASAMRPENTTLVVVGDLSAAEAEAAITKFFGDWRPVGSGFRHEPADPGKDVESTRRVETVGVKDKSQDDVAMGFRGISRSAKDYEAAELMNLILGGDEFVGRVGKRVRDTEGLAYYAYTSFTPAIEAGPWVFRAGVNPQNVSKAIASARDEIVKMAARGVTQSELEWAKDNSIGTLQLSLETASGISAHLQNEAFFGLGLDYTQKYPAIIKSLTKFEVDAAARKYLRPDSLITVIAGPPSK